MLLNCHFLKLTPLTCTELNNSCELTNICMLDKFDMPKLISAYDPRDFWCSYQQHFYTPCSELWNMVNTNAGSVIIWQVSTFSSFPCTRSEIHKNENHYCSRKDYLGHRDDTYISLSLWCVIHSWFNHSFYGWFVNNGDHFASSFNKIV